MIKEKITDLLPIGDRVELFLRYLEEQHGIIGKTIEVMQKEGIRITSKWVERHRKKDLDFDTTVRELQDITFVYVEKKLFELIANDHAPSIHFYLKTHSKEYQPVTEVTYSNISKITAKDRIKILSEIKGSPVLALVQPTLEPTSQKYEEVSEIKKN